MDYLDIDSVYLSTNLPNKSIEEKGQARNREILTVDILKFQEF